MATEQTKPEEKSGKKVITEAELAAKKARVEALQREQQSKLLDEEIFKLEHGGKSRKEVKLKAEAEEKRSKTLKDTHNGKQVACYRLTQVAYKPLSPGEQPALQQPGAIVKIPIDRLPGECMIAIKQIEPEAEPKFTAA